MTPRRFRSWLVLAGIVGIAHTTPRIVADSAVTTASAPAILNLRLTVSSELPAVARKALTTEAESIWREGHLKLRWLTGRARPESGPSLRVLVTPRAVASATEGSQWTVGQLLRFDGSTAIAVASITGAERIVEETQSVGLEDLPVVRQHRLGIVLGRAVAHEIGHYVLDTNTHAPYGLMRAAIDAREFADLRAGSFRLDRQAQAHLAARAALGAFFLDTPDAEFSYSTP